MTEHMVISITDSLNSFPNKDGVDKNLSPNIIILVSPHVDYNTIRVSFGSYVQVFEKTDNTMKIRSVGDFSLSRSKENGSYYFM